VLFPLIGPRVQLRPFELSDVQAAHRVYSDERVMLWVGEGGVSHPAQTEAMLREYIEHQRLHGFSFWAVIERATREVIGDAGLYTRGGKVELGYTLAYEYWGCGYGTEAAGLCVRTASDVGLRELIALARPANAPSVAVIEKLGFKPREWVTAGRLGAHGVPPAAGAGPGVPSGETP
jgi:ribosomal-protein-alanine N-acetyltransferase